ncbi:MAG: 3-dehydroquinate synthase family protein, partial [Dehalococcoidia bacterium]|nr:3-dehydroquinate synthase family protein [Dehalococcoidia bacterium]
LHVPTVFAFGGGVVGDVAGFVAAVYRRGVPVVQLPTTLLAQVDSAIGGKTGVDLPQGKNLLGAFYQPRLVYNNLTVLRGLPPRQRRSGLAEIIKYGAIADPALFAYLETHLAACLALVPRAVRVLIERSCAIKARVVSEDERETRDVRVRLNFGHTLGHALEAATGYRRFTHGEAIAVGMCFAAHLSWAHGRLSEPAFWRIVTVIERAGLPSRVRGVRVQEVLRAMRYDKKFARGRPRWVLLQRLGAAQVTEDVPEEMVRRLLPRYVSARNG